jgi:hypothetical protein
MRQDISTRFWAKVNMGEHCWTWTGCTNKIGRPFFNLDGRIVLAYRVAYELMNGPIPVGLFVCHHCDNSICVRPSHLFVGSNQDNMTDMVRKGRYQKRVNLPKGSAIKTSKLTEAQVAEIKAALKAKPSQPQLARQYGVSTTVINNIAHGKVWRHVC